MDTVKTITLSSQLNLTLLSLSRQDAPRESCGLFLGKRERQGAVVDQFLPLSNVALGTERFRIDPRAYREVERKALGCQQEIVGIFHSHPRGAPEPSMADLSWARSLWGDEYSWIYMIYGLEGRRSDGIRGWQLGKGVFSPVFVEISGVSGEFLRG